MWFWASTLASKWWWQCFVKYSALGICAKNCFWQWSYYETYSFILNKITGKREGNKSSHTIAHVPCPCATGIASLSIPHSLNVTTTGTTTAISHLWPVIKTQWNMAEDGAAPPVPLNPARAAHWAVVFPASKRHPCISVWVKGSQ